MIPGWEEGLQTMQLGGRRMLIVPPELAYGKKGIKEKNRNRYGAALHHTAHARTATARKSVMCRDFSQEPTLCQLSRGLPALLLRAVIPPDATLYFKLELVGVGERPFLSKVLTWIGWPVPDS